MPRSSGPALPNPVARQLRAAVVDAEAARERADELRQRRNDEIRRIARLYDAGPTELSRRSGLTVETVRAILAGRT